MKNFLKHKLWPVIAGLIVAIIIMTLFEYVNSFFYPLPEELDVYNQTSVMSFTKSLPYQAFILVWLGYFLASCKAGGITTMLSKEKSYKLSAVVGFILTIFAIINFMTIGHPVWFVIISLPVFIIFTYTGHRYMRNKVK